MKKGNWNRSLLPDFYPLPLRCRKCTADFSLHEPKNELKLGRWGEALRRQCVVCEWFEYVKTADAKDNKELGINSTG